MRPLKWKKMSVSTNKLSHFFVEHAPHRIPQLNGPIHMEFATMNNFLQISMEAELGELFFNCQLGTTPRISLEEMDQQLPPTPVIPDSATSNIFLNGNIRQQISRSIDMILYSVRDRMIQGHHLVYWEIVKNNLANYFTKHHPTKHHRAIIITYLFPTDNSSNHS